jgi:hypothetical protein
MHELAGATRDALLIIVRSLFFAGNCGPSRIARTRSQLKGRDDLRRVKLHGVAIEANVRRRLETNERAQRDQR